MTSLTAARQASARSLNSNNPNRSNSSYGSAQRIWRIVRLHYTNWRLVVVVPWAILLGILLVNMAIWYLVVYGTGVRDMDTQYTGSVFSLFGYQAVIGIQAMSLTFSYAIGIASTRRDFYLGTALWFLLHCAQFTIGIVLLSYLEQWTSGWGVGGHVFQTIYFGTGGLGERLFTVYFGLVGVMFLGSIFGAVYVRWRTYGLYAVGAIFVLGLLAIAAVLTLTHGWGAVGAWFLANSTPGLIAWSIPFTAACAVVAYLALRRAVPRG